MAAIIMNSSVPNRGCVTSSWQCSRRRFSAPKRRILSTSTDRTCLYLPRRGMFLTCGRSRSAAWLAERSLARLGKINPTRSGGACGVGGAAEIFVGPACRPQKSRDDLLHIVRDIDEHVEEVLDSALRDVSQYFEVVFERLFPGGQGRMVLTGQGARSLPAWNSRRPPGKRVKRLSLLSGGERSLTSIAFMVAIFMARPSPFYVMDEVEAALDDVNLSRLLDIFRDLQGVLAAVGGDPSEADDGDC